ncbi:MAG TPA: alpha/beta fold hydrolase [Ilumatobacteraceae bacterium]|nr:alpha/beta fold hydrolase [Ilumatobacteraceae bacterium]
MRFTFENCELDPGRYEVRRDGEAVAVEPQVFDVLVHLVRHRDRVVSKEELLDEVWGDRFVSESALTSRIKAARRAIGDDGTAQRMIRTVHGRGYRFVAEALEQVGTSTGDENPRRAEQRVQFCTAPDGVRLAYATVGHGPPLVKVANWLTHLEYDWESPMWQHWWRDLSAGHNLVRYDERGCGLSDWDVDDFSLDTWVADLETVVDAAGLDRFPLLGISQGGPVAITYATRHPERVSGLILYGTYTQGRLARARTPQAEDEARLHVQLVRLGWGHAQPEFRRVFAMQFMPHGTLEQWNAFDELQRLTTSPTNAVRFMEAFSIVDVLDVAPTLSVPTLVLHARRDARVPVAEGRELATLIPGSRFVTLESSNHLLLGDEPAWPRFMDEVEAFLAELT